MRLALILLSLCAACPAPPARPASPIVAVRGHRYAVVHLDGWIAENASNAGGLHFTFSVDGLPPDRLVHAGGHAAFGDGITLPDMTTARDASWPHRYYLADLTLGPDPIQRPCPTTWCTYPMPTYHGQAYRLFSAASLAAARGTLAALPRTGDPGPEVVLRR